MEYIYLCMRALKEITNLEKYKSTYEEATGQDFKKYFDGENKEISWDIFTLEYAKETLDKCLKELKEIQAEHSKATIKELEAQIKELREQQNGIKEKTGSPDTCQAAQI